MNGQRESAFSPGDFVEIVMDYEIDYSDCTPPGSIYTIPKGSHGYVTYQSLDFSDGYRAPILFDDVENYPRLCHGIKGIGPGHYIPERMLRIIEEGFANEISPIDLDGLF